MACRTAQAPRSCRDGRYFFYSHRDRRSLFPENPRPPPGLDSCVCAHVFRGLARSSTTTLEGRPADSGALLRFPGGSRPLLDDSGEKSCVLTFFRHDAGPWIPDIPIFSKRAKSTKIKQNPKKSSFFHLDHSCNFLNRSGGGAAESGALLRFLGVSRPLLHDSGEKSCGPTFFQ